MDKSWMKERNRFSEKYVLGVRSFIRFAKDHIGANSGIRCPCCECLNVDIKSIDEVEDDIFMHGISMTYDPWIYHGESSHRMYSGTQINDIEDSDDEEIEDSEEEEGDEMHELIEDVYRGTFVEANTQSFGSDTPINVGERETRTFDKLLEEAERELYPNCKKFSTLSFLIKLLHLKVMNRWSNKSFDMLLELLKEALPDGRHFLSHIMRQKGCYVTWD